VCVSRSGRSLSSLGLSPRASVKHKIRIGHSIYSLKAVLYTQPASSYDLHISSWLCFFLCITFRLIPFVFRSFSTSICETHNTNRKKQIQLEGRVALASGVCIQIYRFFFFFFVCLLPVHPPFVLRSFSTSICQPQHTNRKKQIQSEGGVALASGVFIRFTDCFLVFFRVYLLPVHPFRLKVFLNQHLSTTTHE